MMSASISKNITGQYIYLSRSGNILSGYTYTFSLSSSKTGLTYDGSNLSGVTNSNTRYIQLSSGSVSAASNSGTSLTAYVLTASVTKPSYTITITNTPVEVPEYELPETGGIGQIPYTAGGLLLMTAAGLTLLYNHKKRGKEDPASS